jgi:uncharacterized protein with GYD domain
VIQCNKVVVGTTGSGGQPHSLSAAAESDLANSRFVFGFFVRRRLIRRQEMPTYIALVKFTAKGLENIKNQPRLLKGIRKAYEEAGCELKAVYLTMGQYDLVTISEAPDDTTLAKLFLSFATAGTVVSETLRAFTEAEYVEIVSALS